MSLKTFIDFTVFNYKSRDFSGSPAFTAVAPGSIIDRGIKFLQATQLRRCITETRNRDDVSFLLEPHEEVSFYFRGERMCELRDNFLCNYFWDTYFHLRKSHTRKWSPFLINQTIHFIQGPLLFLKANIADSEVKYNSGMRLPLPLIKSCD